MAQELSPVVPYDGSSSAGKETVIHESTNKLGSSHSSSTKQAWDERDDAAALGKAETENALPLYRWVENGLLVLLAIIDNVLCYVTYFTIHASPDDMYNIIDLHVALLSGIDTALLVFAIIGTASFVVMIAAVECFKKPLFHEIMNIRLFISALPCGAICAILVYHTEHTEWAPFTTLMTILFLIFIWCLHMRTHYSHQLNTLSKTMLDISWFLAFFSLVTLLILFSTGAFKIITKSDELNCPYTDNKQMPIRVLPLEIWYCSTWGNDHRAEIVRAPVNNTPMTIKCSDSFVDIFGVSIDPHLFRCPSGCLNAVHSPNVVGCNIYSLDTSICLAAIQTGVLTDQGGQAVVYGRVGIPQFEQCSYNSVTSTSRYVTQSGTIATMPTPSNSGSSTYKVGGSSRRLVEGPLVIGSDGTKIPQAFHFNNLAEIREFVWLKSWQVVSSLNKNVNDGKPWTKIEGVVSMRFAGIELENEKIHLGQSQYKPMFVQARTGQVFEEQPAQCRIRETGVLCQGVGSAVVQLDFCLPDFKKCLEK